MEKGDPVGTGPVKWVSTEWLGEHLTDSDLVIIDVQPNVHDYIQEHIPGAVYMNEGLFRVPLGGLPAQFIPGDVMQSHARRLGLMNHVPVVVYTGTGPYKGWGDGLEQTMAAYTLARFGHDAVFLLDGGIDAWKGEGRPLSQEFPAVTASRFSVDIRRELFVEYPAFVDMKDGENVLLLDARPPAVYEGQGPWIKPGHIPGAVNVPWTVFMDETNRRLLKPDTAIQAILSDYDITPAKRIICSCGTGREATNEFILLKWRLAFPDVLIYEGSFTEWSSYPDNPTVTGKSPR